MAVGGGGHRPVGGAGMNAGRAAAGLLGPYGGRAVVNAGAVMFHGVTDDTLTRAAALRGDGDEADRLRTRALATSARLGARWWRRRLEAWTPATSSEPADGVVHLHPAPGGLWLVGPTVHTGQYCSYDPDPGHAVRWLLD
jgi:hypothetical protein